jgi:hypothetical protein
MLIRKPGRKRPIGTRRLCERVTLNWILKKKDVKLWTSFMWHRIGFSGGICEHGNESSGPIKGG